MHPLLVHAGPCTSCVPVQQHAHSGVLAAWHTATVLQAQALVVRVEGWVMTGRVTRMQAVCTQLMRMLSMWWKHLMTVSCVWKPAVVHKHIASALLIHVCTHTSNAQCKIWASRMCPGGQGLFFTPETLGKRALSLMPGGGQAWGQGHEQQGHQQ